MHVEAFLNVISECDILRDDIDDIRQRVQLTQIESTKLGKALSCVDRVKSILSDLFPKIKSLGVDVREELQAQLGEID
jgi:hypothetical protein